MPGEQAQKKYPREAPYPSTATIAPAFRPFTSSSASAGVRKRSPYGREETKKPPARNRGLLQLRLLPPSLRRYRGLNAVEPEGVGDGGVLEGTDVCAAAIQWSVHQDPRIRVPDGVTVGQDIADPDL